MAVYRDWLPADNYSSIPNHWLRDYRLSYKAKGLISYIASHKPGYRLSMTQIIAESDDGKSAVYAAIKELTRYDYLITERTRGETGKLGDTNYRFGPAAYEQRYIRAWRTDAAQDHIRKSDPGLDQHKHQDHKEVSENRNVVPTCEDTEFPQLTTTSENRNVVPTCGNSVFPQVGTRIRFSTSGKSTTKKNSLLEDQFQEDKTPPTPHAAANDHASGLAATEGGGKLGGDKPQPQNQPQERADGESQLVLRDVCHALAPTVIPVGGSRARLLVLVDRALGAGWSRSALVERIAGNGLEGLDQAGRVFGMLRYRLEHVGAPDDCRPVPSRPLVAGRTGHHRYVEDMPGYDQCAVCGMGRRNFRHGGDAPVIGPEGCEPGLVADPSVPPREAAVRALVGAFRGLSV